MNYSVYSINNGYTQVHDCILKCSKTIIIQIIFKKKNYDDVKVYRSGRLFKNEN